MGKVEIISPKILQTNQELNIIKLKVAAYCRVSTEEEEQINSYESQISYYTDKIKENPEWEFAGIYADEGITGTKVDKRTEFLRMIKDAEAGKIDLILVKSISRFGRNTVDILNYIRKLKALNIAVYFEEENINTLKMQGEILISVLAALAQQGSSTISSSVILGNKMKMKRGELVGRYECYGYRYNEETENLEIVEEQAEIVRKVFDLYVSGMGSSRIAQKMNKEGYVTATGKKWRDTTVCDMIKNEKYVGDLMSGKNYTVDPIEHTRKENRGEKEFYHAINHHEGIIDRKTYNKAREILQKRSQKYNGAYAPNKYSTQYAFSSKIVCGYCGQTFYRWKRILGKDNHELITWVCSTKKMKKNGMVDHLCDNFNYRDDTIKNAFVKTYSVLCKNNKAIIEKLLDVIKDVLSDDSYTREIDKLQRQVKTLKDKQSSLVDMKLEGLITQDIYLEKYQDLNSKLDLLNVRIEEYTQVLGDNKNIKSKIDRFKQIFNEPTILEEFSREVFEAVVEKIIIGKVEEDGTKNPYYIKFILNTGTEIIDDLPKKSKKGRKKNDADLGDHVVAQNNVSFSGDRKW